MTGRLCPRCPCLAGSLRQSQGRWLVASAVLWPRKEHSAPRDQLCRGLCAEEMTPSLSLPSSLHAQLALMMIFSPSEAVPFLQLPPDLPSSHPPASVLQKTDITAGSLAALACSKVKRVWLVGRRGPLQVAFTIKVRLEVLEDSCVSQPGASGCLFLVNRGGLGMGRSPRCPPSCTHLLASTLGTGADGQPLCAGGNIFLPPIARSCGR